MLCVLDLVVTDHSGHCVSWRTAWVCGRARVLDSTGHRAAQMPRFVRYWHVLHDSHYIVSSGSASACSLGASCTSPPSAHRQMSKIILGCVQGTKALRDTVSTPWPGDLVGAVSILNDTHSTGGVGRLDPAARRLAGEAMPLSSPVR